MSADNFQSIFSQTSAKANLLNIKERSTPSVNSTRLTLESFTTEYKRRFPNSILFSRFNVFFQEPKILSSTNIYYSSKVCYVLEENYTCSGKPYANPKKNTYTLCPICDPFGSKGGKAHFEKRQGEQLEFDGSEPRFYDTLHSKYDHHMNHVHGVYKDGTTAPQPMIALSEGANSIFQLNTICPMASKDNDHACLWINKIILNSAENPFKAYLRHYTTFHNKNGNKIDCGCFYDSLENKCLYPVDLHAFESSLQDLSLQCSTPPMITYSNAFNGTVKVANVAPVQYVQPVGQAVVPELQTDEGLSIEAIEALMDFEGELQDQSLETKHYTLNGSVNYKPIGEIPSVNNNWAKQTQIFEEGQKIATKIRYRKPSNTESSYKVQKPKQPSNIQHKEEVSESTVNLELGLDPIPPMPEMNELFASSDFIPQDLFTFNDEPFDEKLNEDYLDYIFENV